EALVIAQRDCSTSVKLGRLGVATREREAGEVVKVLGAERDAALIMQLRRPGVDLGGCLVAAGEAEHHAEGLGLSGEGDGVAESLALADRLADQALGLVVPTDHCPGPRQ